MIGITHPEKTKLKTHSLSLNLKLQAAIEMHELVKKPRKI